MNCACLLKIYEASRNDHRVKYDPPTNFEGSCEEGIKKLSELIIKKGIHVNVEATSLDSETRISHRFSSNFLGTKVAIKKIEQFAANPSSEN